MLTLLVTALATAYFVVPALMAHCVVSYFFVPKVSTGTRSEDVVRASFWSIGPLLLAIAMRHLLHLETIPQFTSADSKIVFAGLYSDKVFAENTAEFYGALHNFARFHACLLGLTYIFVLAFAVLFGWVARSLGPVRAKFKKDGLLYRALHAVFLHRVSEWHVALSPMLVHDRKGLIVRIDVLSKGGTLYRGNVFDKRINANGDLACVTLKEAQRLLRDDFLRDRTAYEEKKIHEPLTKKPDTEDYWRKIPGEIFLINGGDIATVNVRHVRQVGVLSPQQDIRLKASLESLNAAVEKYKQEQKQLADIRAAQSAQGIMDAFTIAKLPPSEN